MTFVSYRKTQIKDQESKKFCNFLKDWTKRKAYNIFPHQFKYISTYYFKDLAPLSKGCELYYMITLNMYTLCNICPYHLFILFVNVERYSIMSIDSNTIIHNMLSYNLCVLYRWKIRCLLNEKKNYNHLYNLGGCKCTY
jgi:hypothetical protein